MAEIKHNTVGKSSLLQIAYYAHKFEFWVAESLINFNWRELGGYLNKLAVERGMDMVVKLLNRESYPNQRVWYEFSAVGVWLMMSDVRLFYQNWKGSDGTSLPEFLGSASEDDFLAFLANLPGQMRRTLLVELYRTGEKSSEDRLGKLQSRWRGIQDALKTLKNEDREKYVVVLTAHEVLDDILFKQYPNCPCLRTFGVYVPIAFTLVLEDVGKSSSTQQPSASDCSTDLVYRTAVSILHEKSEEDLMLIIKQAVDIINSAVVNRTRKIPPDIYRKI